MVDLSQLPVPLKRTGQAIDRIIALPLERLGDWVEAKLKSNANEHFEAVEKSRTARKKKASIDESKLSIEKICAIDGWTKGAAEIDPDDKIMSAAWRAALDRLMDGDVDDQDLLDVVTTLPKRTLRSFVSYFGRRNIFLSLTRMHEIPMDDLRKLQESGLIEPLIALKRVLFFAVPFIAMVGWLLAAPNRPSSFEFTSRLMQSELWWLIGHTLILLLAAAYGLSNFFRPTRFGRLFLGRVRLYLEDESSRAPAGASETRN